ncbi:hypothetical protein BSZ31_00630 [Limnobacter sp. SAORIC-690]|uniref:site-specific integrase n=1 Tax=Limnobacter sp. SAORIC-690 TaxID=1923970 RepID=UPI000CF468F7|nr:site-specific integrase [Limnobacter sp. SAORIC-690]PQJ23707.1 hypothetical protein BSZ31_00630 [Limnobacter sp. SAORIC-690]
MNAPEKHITEVPWPNPIEVTIEFERKHVLHPERALIDCGIDGAGKHFKTPLGVVCFGQRRKGAVGNRHTWSVNPETLIPKRRAVVSRLIDFLCEKYFEASAKTKLNSVNYFRCVFDWIDKVYLSSGKHLLDFENTESLKAMYCAYTLHLKHTVMQSQTGKPNPSSKGMSNNGARAYQYSARQLIMACTGLDEETVKSWAEHIGEKNSAYAVKKAQDNEAIERFHDHLVEVIDAHHQIYVQKNKAVIDSEQWGWLIGTRTDFNKSGYKSVTVESQYRAFALIGFYLMVLSTGQNESVLLGLKANELEINRLNKTTYRVGKKGRAKGKEIIVEMGSEHKPIFEKYLAVRKIIAPPNNPFLFPDCQPESNKAVNSTKPLSKLWIQALGGKVFKARALRRFYARKMGKVAQQMGVHAGDVNGIISMMLQNEPQTATQYSVETLEQMAEPLSNFLGQLHDACIEKSRTEHTIKVHMKEHREADRTTASGACESESGLSAELAEGFTELVTQPVCGQWESCLFCKHYGAHADEIDLKKLLSLKAVIETLHIGMDEGDFAHRFAALLHRIEEVIKAMLHKNPSLTSRVEAIKAACAVGDLDEFWAVYMRTLKLNGYQAGGAL